MKHHYDPKMAPNNWRSTRKLVYWENRQKFVHFSKACDYYVNRLIAFDELDRKCFESKLTRPSLRRQKQQTTEDGTRSIPLGLFRNPSACAWHAENVKKCHIEQFIAAFVNAPSHCAQCLNIKNSNGYTNEVSKFPAINRMMTIHGNEKCDHQL